MDFNSTQVPRNASRYSHSGKQYGVSSKKLKIEVYDPAIALLGIYPWDTGVLF